MLIVHPVTGLVHRLAWFCHPPQVPAVLKHYSPADQLANQGRAPNVGGLNAYSLIQCTKGNHGVSHSQLRETIHCWFGHQTKPQNRLSCDFTPSIVSFVAFRCQYHQRAVMKKRDWSLPACSHHYHWGDQGGFDGEHMDSVAELPAGGIIIIFFFKYTDSLNPF